MRIRALRKKNVSGDRLINTFNKEFRRTGFIKKALEHRYHRRKPNKTKIREAAIVASKYRKENERKKHYN